MKKVLKFLHVVGGIGLTGALTVHIILLWGAPEPTDLAGYDAIRQAIAAIAKWLLLPSLGLVLTSGLLAIAAHPPFRDDRWVWVKVALGLSVFEGTLVSIQGPAVRAAEVTARAVAGEVDPAAMTQMIHSEWGALWVVLTVSIANIVLGVWRPKLKRRRREVAGAASGG